ncbi:MAG: hypothetical protein HN765_01580 [Euryarchaeota archaeon]|jgi:hypothetical protein|nr:hypothetical protein [Euryarchaeota archaeon]
MAGKSSKRSPWALRLGILGSLLLLAGGVALTLQTSAIDSIYDPRERATVEIDYGDSAVIEVNKDECFMAVAFSNASDSEIEIKKIVGSAAANEVIVPVNCFTDWTPMASDGATFEIIEEWVTDESGELMVSASCEETDCDGQVVWIVNVEDWQMEIFDSAGLTLGFSFCCFGIVILPIAAIIAYSNRSKAVRGTLNVIGRDDEFLRTLQEQDQSMVAQHPMLQKLKEELERQQMAETEGEQDQKDDSYVDGSKAVMQGQLLTTEQIYALMRGDVEEMSRSVEDPFADSVPKTQSKRVEPKQANTEQISLWDMGGDAPRESGPTQRPASNVLNEATAVQQDNSTNSKDWADWDDM